MKWNAFIATVFLSTGLSAQSLQLHYDFRHTLDPEHRERNYPTLYFEYFKDRDSTSFLFKAEYNLTDKYTNMGQSYVQFSKTLRYWQPKIRLHLSYSGGLGLIRPRQYSYSIANAFALGLNYPFQFHHIWLSTVVDYKLTTTAKLSHDIMFTQYWWAGFFRYRLEFSGDFSVWTQNRDTGENPAIHSTGKQWEAFGEPQIWYNLTRRMAFGSRINLYFHILSSDNRVNIYPTLGVKFKL